MNVTNTNNRLSNDLDFLSDSSIIVLEPSLFVYSWNVILR